MKYKTIDGNTALIDLNRVPEIYPLPDDFYSESLFNTKFKFINRKTYKGKGRPRKIDYIPMTAKECNQLVNKALSDFIEKI